MTRYANLAREIFEPEFVMAYKAMTASKIWEEGVLDSLLQQRVIEISRDENGRVRTIPKYNNGFDSN